MNGERQYTAEEKRQLLANLDLEVAHRIRQFEDSLADILENFRRHHEGQVSRVPRLVRGITMAEFGDKYNGDIQECLRGLQKERAGGEPVPIDASVRKRKWQETHEGAGPSDAGSSRAPKTARTSASPKKHIARHERLPKTPGTTRTANRVPASPSPTKSIHRTSPTKPSTLGHARHPAARPISRVPSSATFNPHLPKTPGYPRRPRQNESMLSLNGSPLVNPYAEEPDGSEEESDGVGTAQKLNGRGSSQPSSSTLARSRSHAHINSQSSHSIPAVPGFSFDPLHASPSALDAALSNTSLTDSAKKRAREDVAKLVREAMDKWKI